MKKRHIPAFFLLLLYGCNLRMETAPGYRRPALTPPPSYLSSDWPESDILSLSFLGDIMAHNVNYLIKPYGNIYQGVKKHLQADDLTFGNLEFPINARLPMSTFPRFNVHPEYAEEAVKAGIEVFSLANNHTTDRGVVSLLATLATMDQFKKQYPIYYSGIRRKKGKGFQITTIEKKGWKIGFIAITQFLNIYTGKEYVYLVNFLNTATKNEFLKFLKQERQKYDLFILSFHGGMEYATQPRAQKKRFFDELLEAGVDIVWGHHPHVLQPWELVTSQGKKKLIIYSNGNFISGQTWWLDPEKNQHIYANRGDSAIYKVRVVKKKDQSVTIVHVAPLLISNLKTEEKQMIVKPLEELKTLPLPKAWHRYYQNRFTIMETFILPWDSHNIPQ